MLDSGWLSRRLNCWKLSISLCSFRRIDVVEDPRYQISALVRRRSMNILRRQVYPSRRMAVVISNGVRVNVLRSRVSVRHGEIELLQSFVFLAWSYRGRVLTRPRKVLKQRQASLNHCLLGISIFQRAIIHQSTESAVASCGSQR